VSLILTGPAKFKTGGLSLGVTFGSEPNGLEFDSLQACHRKAK